MIAVAMIFSSRSLEAQSAGITGVVRNVSGEMVSGALVKVRSEALGLGFMVVSQGQGQYGTPNLLPGKYTVQGFGAGFQSAPGVGLEVSSGRQEKVDLILSIPLPIAPRAKRLTDEDYEKLMPEEKEGGIKQILVSDCKECHTLGWTVSARKSREKWQQVVERMYNDLLGRRLPLWFALKDDEFAGGNRKNLIVDYLAKNFGPDTPPDARVLDQSLPRAGGPAHPNRNLSATLLNGAAAKYVAMEFSLPRGSMPHDIAVDSQGIVWVTERNTGMLGRFDPRSLAYTRITCPPGKDSTFQLNAVTVDPKDQVWFVDDGPNARILQYNPKDREFNSYPISEYRWPVPDIGWARIETLRFSNGNLWATRTTAQRILKLDPNTRKSTEFSSPRGSVPFGLAIGGDSRIWYTAEVGNVVVRLDPTTGRLTPYDVPTPRSDLRGLAADAEGNLWAAATESGKLVSVDYRTGKVTEYTPPTEESGPFAIDVDTKRNFVWFSEILSDRIARFDPSTNTFVEFPTPSADLDVRRIEVDRSHPNRLWWAGASGDKIGYIELLE